ncbi:MAG: hypothetical protein Q8O12_04965 [Candidatus Omnitrophota bacterium]|nr:hypothetical protein [Candidatus Omnitrophota bacterium]
MPKDPAAARTFWGNIGRNDVDGVMERIIINNGMVLYDGAGWMIVMANEKNFKQADIMTNVLSSGSWGKLHTIRASEPPFKYQGRELPGENSYFFRIITHTWEQNDPLDNKDHIPGYPGPSYDNSLIVWADLEACNRRKRLGNNRASTGCVSEI